MGIDRDATLKKAEKFLRQGRLDQAIAEYHRIIEEQPEDWSTINAVGDLLIRSGQIESGVEHFGRIADHFFDEGFFPRAAAVYKKILKLSPDQDHAALRTADIAEQQGLVADAKSALSHVAARRIKRGDKAGAAEIHLRLGRLDPADLGAAAAAAKAAAELGDLSAAVEQMLRVADEYRRRERPDESIRVLSEAIGIDETNQAVRRELSRQLLESGALERSVEFASSAAEYKAIAAAYYELGRSEEALRLLAWALEQDPSDLETRRRLVRGYVGRADFGRARGLLEGEVADAELLMALGEVELRSGRHGEGRGAVARAVAADPGRRDEVLQLGLSLAAADQAAGFECVDVATDAAIAGHEFGQAARALDEFVALVPRHIPALMKLVEVCVDGDLHAQMYVAQAQLADAYLEQGMATEARVIAEDLFAREPWEPAHIERFRKALTILGDPDPDSVIADRLSGDSPFTSTDLTLDFSFGELARELAAVPAPGRAADPEPAADPLAAPSGPVPDPAPERLAAAPAAAGGLEIAVEPGDPEVVPKSRRRRHAVEPAQPEADGAIEIDLGEAAGDWGAEDAGTAAAPAEPAGLAGLERVFEGFREEAVRHGMQDIAAQLQQALSLEEAGETGKAIHLFERVARSPRGRLRAASELARIHRRLGHGRESIEWLEQAVESSAAGTEESHDLLYDLGLLLSEAGETERALAVMLELQADVPDYRDVARQIARLSQKA